MANRIFRSILLVALIVLVSTVAFTVNEMYQSFFRSQMELLEAQTKIIGYGIDEYGLEFLNDYDETDFRVTIIDKKGKVIYDNSGNDISAMDNHLDRKEVKEAFEDGYGSSSRQSSTLTQKYVYTAMRLKNGNVVRLSSIHSSIFHVIFLLIEPLLILILIILVVSLFFAFQLTRNIVDPLNQINVEESDIKSPYKEISPILNKLSAQQKMLKKDREILLQKKQEFETITENMNEGMVLLNMEGVIIDVNKAARDIMESKDDVLGTHISEWKYYDKIKDLISNVLNKHHGNKHVKINDVSYDFEISPIEVNDNVSGFVLLIFDRSFEEANENMRKEFASNVSHELKTPLQSISGYAELLKSGIVKKDDEKQCLDKIYSESQRMIMLVKDVIKLSHLDDEETLIVKEKVDLGVLTEETLEMMKNDFVNGVKLETNIKDECFVYGNKELLETIISNLIENAIKYNVENGTVFVDVYKQNKKVILKVKDTGIGIDPKDHERIFERFYRVDKARSKQVGGTGLGLSIVKHSCILNNATIRLESALNEGSTFIVEFEEA